MNRSLKIRILPLTIFFAAFMLTVKVGSVWTGLGGSAVGTIAVAGADAQQAEPTPGAKPQDKPQEKSGDTAGKEPPEKQAAKKQAPKKQANVADDPALLTQSEISVLQQLADRRSAIEAREQGIGQRVALMKAAERRIDKKIEDLQALRVAVEGLLKTHDGQQAKRMQSLVKIYEAMKPKDAARIFEELDLDTLLLVAERMKERKLAPIMAKMNPKKAKTMTVELTKLRKLPNPGS